MTGQRDPERVGEFPDETIEAGEETLSRVIDLLEADEGTEPWLQADMLANAKRRLPPGVGEPEEQDR
jgi:hypothetical protein